MGGAPMGESLLDEVRDVCREVAQEARQVHIVAGSVERYASSVLEETLPRPELDPAHHFLGDAADTVAFILTLDTVNFGSGYFPHLQKLPGHSGYFTVATRLSERFHQDGPFSAQALAELTPDFCHRLFRQ